MDLGTNKSPGPDGFTTEFFKKHWNILKEDIKGVFQDFFESGIINASLNETYICLIPKKIDAKTVGDYRPISLTTCIYKVIARVLSERLKKVLPDLITENQFAFVANRQIIDASLIANELIEEYTKNKKQGVVIKLDIEKAFDMVDWEFLDNILIARGFGFRWRRWIHGCISSANFSIIINGKPRGKIRASRGLRQGDPLSPFLFILIIDCLSRMLHLEAQRDTISGLEIGGGEIAINHLLFADDTILFSKPDKEKITALFDTVKKFEEASGLRINHRKSEFLGINLNEPIVADLAEEFGCKEASWPAVYLGLPLNGKAHTKLFWEPVIEKVERRLRGWNSSYISKGGRLTLIQATLTNLPTYYFSLYKITADAAKAIEKLYRKFLWNGNKEKRGYHSINWQTVRRPLEEGGLGLTELRVKNKSLPAKWIWRFHLEKDALWRRVVATKYGITHFDLLPDTKLLKYHRGPWKQIMEQQSLILDNISCVIGNGKQIAFWHDRWIDNTPNKVAFPLLFALSQKKHESIHEMLNLDGTYWDLGLCRNLKEPEIEEWARLTNVLPYPTRSRTMDTWKWSLDKSGIFTVKSLTQKLATSLDFSHIELYRNLWKGPIPKKIRFFLWEVSHGGINTADTLLKKAPWIVSSPNWCVLCRKDSETARHIFLTCPFTASIWDRFLNASSLQIVIPETMTAILEVLLLGHPYTFGKACLWNNLVKALFWAIWLERNNRLFLGKARDSHIVLEHLLYLALSWCKFSPFFCDYSLSSLLSTWESLL